MKPPHYNPNGWLKARELGIQVDMRSLFGLRGNKLVKNERPSMVNLCPTVKSHVFRPTHVPCSSFSVQDASFSPISTGVTASEDASNWGCLIDLSSQH